MLYPAGLSWPGVFALSGLLQFQQQVQTTIPALALVTYDTVVTAPVPNERHAVGSVDLVGQWRTNVQTQRWPALQVERGELALALHALRHRAKQGVAHVIELQRGIGRTTGHFHERAADESCVGIGQGKYGMAGSWV